MDNNELALALREAHLEKVCIASHFISKRILGESIIRFTTYTAAATCNYILIPAPIAEGTKITKEAVFISFNTFSLFKDSLFFVF